MGESQLSANTEHHNHHAPHTELYDRWAAECATIYATPAAFGKGLTNRAESLMQHPQQLAATVGSAFATGFALAAAARNPAIFGEELAPVVARTTRLAPAIFAATTSVDLLGRTAIPLADIWKDPDTADVQKDRLGTALDTAAFDYIAAGAAGGLGYHAAVPALSFSSALSANNLKPCLDGAPLSSSIFGRSESDTNFSAISPNREYMALSKRFEPNASAKELDLTGRVFDREDLPGNSYKPGDLSLIHWISNKPHRSIREQAASAAQDGQSYFTDEPYVHSVTGVFDGLGWKYIRVKNGEVAPLFTGLNAAHLETKRRILTDLISSQLAGAHATWHCQRTVPGYVCEHRLTLPPDLKFVPASKINLADSFHYGFNQPYKPKQSVPPVGSVWLQYEYDCYGVSGRTFAGRANALVFDGHQLYPFALPKSFARAHESQETSNYTWADGKRYMLRIPFASVSHADTCASSLAQLLQRYAGSHALATKARTGQIFYRLTKSQSDSLNAAAEYRKP